MTSLAYHDPSAPVSAISRALRQALQAGDGLLEWLPIGIYSCDVQGSLVHYNRRAAELWGRSPDTGNGQHRFCGADGAYRPNGEAIPLNEAPMAELLRTGRPIRDRELILERPDGTRLAVLANLDPLFDEDGTLVGGVSCFEDITARKTAEHRLQEREQWYRDLLEALPAAIYTTDAEGRVTFFNEAAADLAGRRPTLGSDEWCVSWKLYSSDGTPVAHEDCPMAMALKTGTPVRGTEAIAERPDGTRVLVLPYPTPLRDADGELIGAVNMLVDITELKEAEEDKTLLLRELAHRVNNTFAVILAITQQSLRTAPSAEAFAEAFTGRLQALAQAHNLLLAKDWAGADLGELAKGQLAPFCLEGGDRLKLEGPKVMLAPTQAIALGVVLHELGTNAAKYGALSIDSGKVELSWKLGADRVCLIWTERHGPPVAPPSRRGLGSKLIERGLPSAGIDWRFEPAGVVCTIDLPLDERRVTNGTGLRGGVGTGAPLST
ncbi:MAG: PAS domain-containing protein [Methyloceanibacter sp.]|nr:PAS domain-containing protein [Methyloceanibacter sp.]